MGELEAGFRAGHEAAVRAVVQRYGGAVSTVARSMIREPELVDEVVQQTFLNAWRAAASFDEERDLAPWLYAIARRTAIDVLRRERRPTAGAHESEVDVAVTPVSFEETFEAFEIRRAIDGLANEERAVVELSHRYGFTHPEIAERLGIPVGTVKSRSARAHRRLAAALGHLAPGANQAGVANVEGGADLS
jgi:RNA polymerase sigma-70 factor (ECF subfamily)